MVVVSVSKTQEFEDMFSAAKLLVIHFYEDWVEQCQVMNKILDEMSTQPEYKSIKFVRILAEKVPEISMRYSVSAVPTFVLLSSGKEYGRVEGANPPELTNKVKALASGANFESSLRPPGAQTGELDLRTRIKALINAAPVMVFMKGSPAEPRCGFSRQTIDILNNLQAQYKSFDILTDNDIREGLKKYSDWPTYPQLYINGVLIGGLDIIKEMMETGERQCRLEDLRAAALNDRLKELTHKADVMVFMKGDRVNPKCGFSRQLMELLNSIGVKFETFDILEDEEVRQGLKDFSNWPTYPQIYVKGSLVGGLDIAKELHAEGSLKETLLA